MNYVPFLDLDTWLKFLINLENLHKSGLFLLNKYYYCITTSLQSFNYPQRPRPSPLLCIKCDLSPPFGLRLRRTDKLRICVNTQFKFRNTQLRSKAVRNKTHIKIPNTQLISKCLRIAYKTIWRICVIKILPLLICEYKSANL